jgi:hypothetical protein
MLQNRAFHSAALLPNGQVLLAGGYSLIDSPGQTSVFDSAEIFDPPTRTFGSTGSMHTPRYSNYAVALPSGKVLVAGGDFPSPSPTAEPFDPASGTFALTGAPVAGLRYYGDATLLSNW